MNQQIYRNLAVWVVLLVMLVVLVTMLRQGHPTPSELSFSDLEARVEAGEVQKVTIEDLQITGRLTDGSDFQTYAPVITPDFLQLLKGRGVEIAARPRSLRMLVPRRQRVGS